jgi:hypothetical protein
VYSIMAIVRRTRKQASKVRMKPLGTILLLADHPRDQTAKTLRVAGYQLLTAFSPDHAVALSVNNEVEAAVLDQEHFIVTENWSVAQSLKMINPRICVILVMRGVIVGNALPPGVDAMVPQRDIEALLKVLNRLVY